MQKIGSILDYSFPFLDPAVWDQDRKLFAYQKDFILRLINTMYETYSLKQPETWVEDVVILGSLTTSKWLFTSDLDVHIRINLDAFIASNMPGSTKEQAFEKLDLTRKEFDRAKILAPMTQHPIEFYFESIEFKPSNVALVGVYSVLQDIWLKEPITFDADLDFEESKKDVVAQAEALAEELDSSLGKIRRDIQRVDELEAVIQAWGKDKQQLFYSKVEQKLKSIEEEILKDLKIKQDLVDARHENQNATSEIEIKFKWLARFGFFGILSNLKTLLEQTGGQVTTQELPLIEKIISQGTIKEAGNVFEVNGVRMFKNPSFDQVEKIYDNSTELSLRYIIDPITNDMFIWDAYKLHHIPAMEALGIEPTTETYDNFTGTISSLEDIENLFTFHEEGASGRQQAASIKEASNAIQDINGVRVYRNPTPEQAVNLFRQSKYRALRYIATAYEDIYMWDASDIEHSQMAEDLGLTEDPDWYNGAGTLTTENNTRQKAEMFSRHSIASIKEAFLKEAFDSDPKETDTQIAIDFDGTIAKDKKFPDIGEPEEGVKEALSKIKDLGYDILIYTCRSKDTEELEVVREYLDKHEIPYDSIFEGEKPFAKFYIDDRAIHFDNWNNVLEKVEKSKKTASSSVLKIEPYGGGVEFPVLINPTKQQVYSLIRKLNITVDDGLRVIHGNNIYVWEARQATHDHVLEYLVSQGLEEHSQVQTGYIFGKPDVEEWFWKNASLTVSSASVVLPVVDPKTFSRKEPYALFIGTGDYGKAGKVDMFNVYGEHPMITKSNVLPTVTLDTLIQNNIPVIGKEPRAGDKQPFQDISKLVKKAYSSIGTNKFWITPDQRIIQIGQSEMHVDWIAHHLTEVVKSGIDIGSLNPKILKGVYFDDMDDATQHNLEVIMNNMQLNGWVRITSDDARTQFTVDGGKQGFGPATDQFVAEHFNPNDDRPIGAHWKGGAYLEIYDPFPTLMQAYRKAARSSRHASLDLEAGYDHAYWLDPNGKLFQVRGADATGVSIDQGESETHSGWILKNLDMLEKEYGIDPHGFSGTAASLVEQGWTRIGDAFGTDWGITVKNTDNIPSFVDDTIAQFASEGAIITVAAPGSYASNYTFEWPVKSIQQEVTKIKNARARVQSPKMQLAPAAKAISKKEIIAQTKKVKQGDYSCLMALVPHDLAQEIVEFGVRNVPDEELYSDEDGKLGRELESHITIKYGLLTNDAKDVRRSFNDEKPFKAKLGKVRHFQPPELPFDVLTVEVISEDLEKANKKICNSFECAKGLVSDEYHPHITIAYMKRDTAKEYIGSDIFDGKEVELDTIIFSPHKGNRTYFSISNDKESSFILETINKFASMDVGYWVDPNGNVYDSHGEGLVHNEWILANLEMLEKNYGFKIPIELYNERLNYYRNLEIEEDNVDMPSSDEVWSQMIESGWVRVGDADEGLGIELNNLRAIPPFMDSLLAEDLRDGDWLKVEDINHNMVGIEYPFKNLQQAVNKALSSPTKTAEFLPSLFQAPDNRWQFEHGGDDKEIALNPDSVSDETTWYAPCTEGKPRTKEVWRQFISMFTNPFSKKEEVKIDSAYDPELEQKEKDALGEDQTLLEYSKDFPDPTKKDFPHNTTWDPIYQDGEPSKPGMPVTYSPESNDVFLDQNSPGGYPRRFMGKPKGEWFSNEGEVNEFLIDMLKNKEAALDSMTRDITASSNVTTLTTPKGESFRVYKNPSPEVAAKLTENSYGSTVRISVAGNDMYMWDAHYGTHDAIMEPLGFSEFSVGSAAFSPRQAENTVQQFLDKKNRSVTAAPTGVGGWISPEGKSYLIPDHISFILKNPKLFGYTIGQLDTLKKADDAMKQAIQNGWVRWRIWGNKLIIQTNSYSNSRKAEDSIYEWVHDVDVVIVQTFPDGHMYEASSDSFIETGWGAFVKTASKKEASIEEVNGIKVLVNPSPQEVIGFWKKSSSKALRALIDPQTGDIFAWDAWQSEHNAFIRYYGLDLDWENEDGTYIRHVSNAADVDYLFEVQTEIRNKLARRKNKIAGDQSASVPDYLINEWKTDQINDDTDEEPYINHDQRDYPYGFQDAPQDTTDFNWPKDNQPYVVRLDILENPAYRLDPFGIGEYNVEWYTSLPAGDGIEKGNPD